ncbi:MAG: hypothetical protein K0U74_00875 [Alphaproteobacteria bacterium]|nr:hypothetical protein [Alphaproteobacteria bacterium]
MAHNRDDLKHGTPIGPHCGGRPEVEANRNRSGWVATTALIVASFGWVVPGVAQEGWPYSEWDNEETAKREPKRAKPDPQRQPVLREMGQPPRFSNDGTTQGYRQPDPGGQWNTDGRTPGRAAPTFATPPSVDRADLTPLEPFSEYSVPSDGAGPGSRPDPGRTNGPAQQFGSDPQWRPSPAGEDRPGSGFERRAFRERGPARANIDPQMAIPLIVSMRRSPRSRVLRGLLSDVLDALPDGGGTAGSRVEALVRLGYVRQAADMRLPARETIDEGKWAGMALQRSMARAGVGRDKDACTDARDIVAAADKLAAMEKDQAILLSGYCGAVAENRAAVELASDVARERSGFDRAGLAGLVALASGSNPRIAPGTTISPLAYRALIKAGASANELIAANVSPAVLVVMAGDKSLPAVVRIVAAEKAAAAALVPAEVLAEAYRSAPAGRDIEVMKSGGEGEGMTNPAIHRAGLFVRAVRQQTPLRKVRLIRSLLDASRKSDLYLPGLELMAQPVRELQPVPEIGWFAETAIEVLLYSGHLERARDWLRLAETADPRGPGALAHWAALLDIAGGAGAASGGGNLASLERLANRGDFRSAELHRLATVLDALNYHVPIPLWEAASRTPQPNDGHLPATGILSRLQQAAKSGDAELSKLLVLNAIGPDGPRGANLIALGDSIRALKRAGLEREARLIGLEALFVAWPRAPQG